MLVINIRERSDRLKYFDCRSEYIITSDLLMFLLLHYPLKKIVLPLYIKNVDDSLIQF